MSSDSEQSVYMQTPLTGPTYRYSSFSGNSITNNHFEGGTIQSQTPSLSRKRARRQISGRLDQGSRAFVAPETEHEDQTHETPQSHKRRRTELREPTQSREALETGRLVGQNSQRIQPDESETVSEEVFKSTKRLVDYHLRVFVLRYGKCGPSQIRELIGACVMQRIGTRVGKEALQARLAVFCYSNQSTWKHRTFKSMEEWVKAQIQQDLDDTAAEEADHVAGEMNSQAHRRTSLGKLSDEVEIWNCLQKRFTWSAAEDVFAFARAQVEFDQPLSDEYYNPGSWWIQFWFLQLAVQTKGWIDYKDGTKHPWLKESMGEYWDRFPQQDDPMFSGISPSKPGHFKMKPMASLSRARPKLSNSDLRPVARHQQPRWRVSNTSSGMSKPGPDDIMQFMQR